MALSTQVPGNRTGSKHPPTLVRAALVIALVTIGTAAQAAKYIVTIKSKQTFAQVQNQIALNAHRNLAAIQVMDASGEKVTLAESTDHVLVEDTLENLNSLVVSADNEADLNTLAESGLVTIEPEIFHPAPEPMSGYHLTQPWDFSTVTALPAGRPFSGASAPWGITAIRAQQAWTLSNRGTGSRIVVLDTGIDKSHPALKSQIEDTRDFVGDNNKPYDVADHVGHGTHVAGTIAGAPLTNGFVGVAPFAKVLAGRVCNEHGCSNIAVATGINWAISKKVDVISMSLGGPVASSAEKRAVEAAEAAGIAVVAATGNNGIKGVCYPGAFPSVVAVGAVDSKIQKAKFSNWGPEVTVVAPGVDVVSSVPMGTGRESRVNVVIKGQNRTVPSSSFVGAPEVLKPLTNNLVFANFGKPEDFKAISVSGKFALVRRGEIPFGDKVKNAIAANAAGVVIFNNESGLLQGAITQDGSTVAVPVVMIEMVVGEEVLTNLKGGAAVPLTVATVPTDYASFAGTSMATPHVSGIVALMRAANRKIRPSEIKAILKSTSAAVQPVEQTGSGMVNAEKAVTAAKAVR